MLAWMDAAGNEIQACKTRALHNAQRLDSFRAARCTGMVADDTHGPLSVPRREDREGSAAARVESNGIGREADDGMEAPPDQEKSDSWPGD